MGALFGIIGLWLFCLIRYIEERGRMRDFEDVKEVSVVLSHIRYHYTSNRHVQDTC